MTTASQRTPANKNSSNGLPRDWTLADLRRHLGDVPLDRIRLFPAPGTAKERDAFEIHRREGKLCELVDGTLVEKPVGTFESILAQYLGYVLQSYLNEHNVGFLMGPDGPVRLFAGRMRMPDVSLVLWKHFPNGQAPDVAVLPRGPDLAIEVISKSNTEQEMEKKLKEYFRASVKLVWYVYPLQRRVVVYTSVKRFRELTEDDVLDGGKLLPGFRLQLRTLFDRSRRGN